MVHVCATWKAFETTQYNDKADGTLMAKMKIIIGIMYVIDVVIPFFSGCPNMTKYDEANVNNAAKIGKMNKWSC